MSEWIDVNDRLPAAPIDIESSQSLWDLLTDIPVDEDDQIEVEFQGFEVGTDKLEIWHWLEERDKHFIVAEVLGL